MVYKGQSSGTRQNKLQTDKTVDSNFVLNKSIFSKVFEKDIRKVYIYKKAERLAKAIHLIIPAFRHVPALGNRIGLAAVTIVDSSILPHAGGRETLVRELLALSSVLSIAKTAGFLSNMNADIINREIQHLLEEIASYEEPLLFLEDMPSLSALSKAAGQNAQGHDDDQTPHEYSKGQNKGHLKDNTADLSINKKTNRRESVLAILKERGPSFIKDISTVIQGVSEKTIQRELQALVSLGLVRKEGNKRWTRYSALT